MTASLAPPLRLARPDEGRAIAELINFAGEGLAEHVWRGLAEPGVDPWTVGEARAAKRAADGEVVAIDEGSGLVAAMIGYPIETTDPVEELPEMFRPLQALENLVVGTWYLNVLAAYPRARGRGLGAALIRHAEALAAAARLSGVSIIVADQNVGARRLYERLGYHELDRRPIVKDRWETPSTHWVLLKNDIDA
ncbi:MAG: GNAT family N-acetyltransferase [Pseudomonadota bacterium]